MCTHLKVQHLQVKTLKGATLTCETLKGATLTGENTYRWKHLKVQHLQVKTLKGANDSMYSQVYDTQVNTQHLKAYSRPFTS